MKPRLFAAAAVAYALSHSPAMAASILDGTFSTGCLTSCLDDHRSYSHAFNLGGGAGPFQIGGLSFNRAILGEFGNSMLHISFWTDGGKTLVDDFGLYLAGVLGGDVLTLKGHSFTFDGTGDLSFKIEVVDWNGDNYSGGEGGGGGGFGGSPMGGGPSGFAFEPPGPPDIDPPGLSRNLSLAESASSVVSSVPEPASWSLLLVGFGGLGALLRRRRMLALAAI